MKATKEHNIVSNKLNRNFKQNILCKILLTDITYSSYGNGKREYLLTIKDSSTNEILSYNVSSSLKIDIVITTIDNLLNNKNIKLATGAYIHSDQGAHYTSPTFQKVLN